MAKSGAPKKRPVEQYEHKSKTRPNNPPVGLVDAKSDAVEGKKSYAYDPHLDPTLVWAGKAERTSFEIPTVSLHVHERIDPRSIIEAVRKKNGSDYEQMSLFNSKAENPPLREAIEFYQHAHNWSNRLIAGDSLLVMNSLLEKEGMAGQVQMVYFDPPYGIKYGSNFQPFVNKRDVKDGKDEDLTAEPEMVKAFRDTWELGIHSYLSYLRDRLLLARELLHESGSVFVQISDENVHHVREICDEVFGNKNFVSLISFQTTSSLGGNLLPKSCDYLLCYAREISRTKFRQLFKPRTLDDDIGNRFTRVQLADETRRVMTTEERANPELLPKGGRIYRHDNLTSQSGGEHSAFPVKFEGQSFTPGRGFWKTNQAGFKRLAEVKRLAAPSPNSLAYVRFFDDFPFNAFSNVWSDTQTGAFTDPKTYVVQTNAKVIFRCLLMTTDPGDLVLDITCGSGTTAYVAEQWGRRWMTCDTSRVAVTLAKQRLMTAVFDYFQLAHAAEGVDSGFRYKTVPHVTLKCIANNEPPEQETLYDQPLPDNSKTRVTGPFTVEAVPAPMVRSLAEISGEGTAAPMPADDSVARSGETVRQSDWRAELLRAGIRGTRWLHADAETKPNDAGPAKLRDGAAKEIQRVVISFGPEHAPLEQKQVELALEEARKLVPRPQLIVFASFQFDPEAAKDIDELNWPGVTTLKAQMNADLLTEDLKKKRTSNESFWLVGQPDVAVVSGQWLVDRSRKPIADYEHIKKLSGLGSLEEINRAGRERVCALVETAERRALRTGLPDAAGGGVSSGKHRRGAGAEQHRGVSAIPGKREGFAGGAGNAAAGGAPAPAGTEVNPGELHGDRPHDERLDARTALERLVTAHWPLTTGHYAQARVHGFDYYDTKTGQIVSGGAGQIAMWMLDTDYDGRSLFPRQVFFPMAGEKEGWSKLAKNLKAEIDDAAIEAYRGTVSLPFAPGNHGRVAVKIVDDRGIESLKILEIQ